MQIGGSDLMLNDILLFEDAEFADDGQIFLELAADNLLNPGEQFTAVISGGESYTPDFDFVNMFADTEIFTDLSYGKLTEGEYAGMYAVTGRLADANTIPEPSTWVLLLLGSFGLLYCRKKK